MKNQLNTTVILEWLLPLLTQQLSKVSTSWQQDAEPNFAQMAQSYNEISGALEVANIPLLAQLAHKLELVSQSGESEDSSLNKQQQRLSAFGHQLLQYELIQYWQTGSYRRVLIQKTLQKLTALLADLGSESEQASEIKSISIDVDSDLYISNHQIKFNLILDPQRTKPVTSVTLQPEQYRQLLLAWRLQVQQLLASNTNEAQMLERLAKVSYYLWQATSIDNVPLPSVAAVNTAQSLQGLWYLTQLWLTDLAQNETPQPEQYGKLLAELDSILEAIVQDLDNQINYESEGDNQAPLYASSSSSLSADTIEALSATIYLRLNELDHVSDAVTAILNLPVVKHKASAEFLLQVLEDLESVVFAIDKPQTLIAPLQKIQNQLAQRGWRMYEAQVAQILLDLEAIMGSETLFTEQQWKIEQQLQVLYASILTIEDTIRVKVGTSFTTITADSDSNESNVTNTLPLVRAIAQIKANFDKYAKAEQTYLPASADAFAELNTSFEAMEFGVASRIIAQLAAVFVELRSYDINTLSKRIVYQVAQSVIAIEWFIDSLAQQVFDQPLLTNAQQSVELAEKLVTALVDDPITISDTYSPMLTITTDVTRYGDEGEIAASDFDEQADDQIDENNELDESTSSEVAVQHIDTSSDNDSNNDNDNILLAVEDTEIADATLGSDYDSESDSAEELDGEDSLANEETLAQEAVSDSAELAVAREQLKPDNFEMDEEIREIFIEEVDEVLTDLNDFLPIWQQDPQDLSPLTEIRRGFHTLKGSGRMVGAFSIGESAWAIENMLNRVLDNTLAVTDHLVQLVMQTTAQMSILIADFAAMRAPSLDPATIVLQSNNLLAGRALSQGLDAEAAAIDAEDSTEATSTNQAINAQSKDEQNIEDEQNAVNNNAQQTEENLSHGQAERLSNQQLQTIEVQDLSLKVSPELAAFIQDIEPLAADADKSDEDIKEIFVEEAEEVLAEITPLYSEWQVGSDDLVTLKEVRRGFHTLKGSGRMVGANYSSELAWAIENMLNRVLDNSITMTTDMDQLISDVLAAYPQLVTIFDKGEDNYPAVVTVWSACANAYSKQQGDKFDYMAVRAQWLAEGEQEQEQSEFESVDNYHTDEADNALQTIHTVNEIMADTPVATTPQSEEDQAFCEIFIEEAQGLLQDINDFVHEHQNETHIEVSDVIVRAFHTLRAASGSDALAAISDISATIEYSLEQLQQQDTPMNPQHLQALAQSVALIEGYLNAYNKQPPEPDIIANSNQNQQDLASLQALLDDSEEVASIPESKLSVAPLLDLDINALLDAEWQLEAKLGAQDQQQVQDYIATVYQQIEQLLAQTDESPKFAALLSALKAAYYHLRSHPELASDTEVQSALLAGHKQLIGLFDALAGSMSLKVDAEVIDALNQILQTDNNNDNSSNSTQDSQEPAVVQLSTETIDTDSELLEIFLEEAQDLDQSIAQTFNKWRKELNNVELLKDLQRYLHTIKGGARMVGISSIGDLAYEAETIYERLVEGRIQPTMAWANFMQQVLELLSLQINHIESYQTSFFATDLISQWREFEQTGKLPQRLDFVLPLQKGQAATEFQPVADNEVRKPELATSTVSLEQLIKNSWPNEQPDPDILEVYLEEADELIESSNQHLKLFLSNNSEISALQSLQRDLHTIKGGARMVAANGIADLAHEMETVYEELADRRRPATNMVSQLLTVCHDWIADAIFILKQGVNPQKSTALIEALQQFSKNPDSLQQIPSESLQNQRKAILAAKANQESSLIIENIDEMPSMTGSFTEQEQNVNSNEMIRISGSLIEHMINLSGESAINRARIDMGMSSLTNSIGEMGVTVQRLADQLRRMETELEAQILSQIDDDLINNEGFDPLEMDQYSSLNQLSKSLSESASDLIDINSTLLEKTRDSESLLLQLSRTQTELQDGLMNSRMVPFTRLKPRFERIVRQVASELDKSVDLTIINADDEMDRTILERITSPLEHMLRNAVDHGIEDTQTRLKAGKSRNGHITLEVLREGSEVVINLTDDGRGINVEAVRSKAIMQGLIDPNDTSLTDLDVMQYIFNAGLTTTNELTQISGRGVGMDVVISEIRQLGGMVSVTSKAGEGSRFTIRVPLTVAISDALVVRAADRYYAIPLVQIERVIRINPEKLYDYYQSDASTLRIEDEDYRVRYLNEILTGSSFDELMLNTNTSLPLIIVKNRSGQKMALQVDQIAGSRIEVVVKPLGRQLSHLAGISAATIMGDGSVLFILDLMALMRNAPVIKKAKKLKATESTETEVRPTVLVVDDSVTVRKVTSRFLERQGIKVMLAKDGIDAIEVLQETIPDLILLDIEMPRMDGFEVATQVRHSERLKQIPIIMITSRTGQKHRQRALDIGVNDYMGKPFQENELLKKIELLLGDNISVSHDG